MITAQFFIEIDSMGRIKVPVDAYCGPQTPVRVVTSRLRRLAVMSYARRQRRQLRIECNDADCYAKMFECVGFTVNAVLPFTHKCVVDNESMKPAAMRWLNRALAMVIVRDERHGVGTCNRKRFGRSLSCIRCSRMIS